LPKQKKDKKDKKAAAFFLEKIEFHFKKKVMMNPRHHAIR